MHAFSRAFTHRYARAQTPGPFRHCARLREIASRWHMTHLISRTLSPFCELSRSINVNLLCISYYDKSLFVATTFLRAFTHESSGQRGSCLLDVEFIGLEFLFSGTRHNFVWWAWTPQPIYELVDMRQLCI